MEENKDNAVSRIKWILPFDFFCHTCMFDRYYHRTDTQTNPSKKIKHLFPESTNGIHTSFCRYEMNKKRNELKKSDLQPNAITCISESERVNVWTHNKNQYVHHFCKYDMKTT